MHVYIYSPLDGKESYYKWIQLNFWSYESLFCLSLGTVMAHNHVCLSVQ